ASPAILTASSEGSVPGSPVGTMGYNASQNCAVACWNLAYSSRRSVLSSRRRSVLYLINARSSATAPVTTTPAMVKIPVTTASNPATSVSTSIVVDLPMEDSRRGHRVELPLMRYG